MFIVIKEEAQLISCAAAHFKCGGFGLVLVLFRRKRNLFQMWWIWVSKKEVRPLISNVAVWGCPSALVWPELVK